MKFSVFRHSFAALAAASSLTFAAPDTLAASPPTPPQIKDISTDQFLVEKAFPPYTAEDLTQRQSSVERISQECKLSIDTTLAGIKDAHSPFTGDILAKTQDDDIQYNVMTDISRSEGTAVSYTPREVFTEGLNLRTQSKQKIGTASCATAQALSSFYLATSIFMEGYKNPELEAVIRKSSLPQRPEEPNTNVSAALSL